ncbi:uncharacterized protein LOC135391716 isoform X3 [Ornithodoros turicata]|uniref:uncharacterized protein LOC135391716 isoform X3 n=1 Tax=Ornithodoros turicata TaxID=34597 RepID=UPI003139CF44
MSTTGSSQPSSERVGRSSEHHGSSVHSGRSGSVLESVPSDVQRADSQQPSGQVGGDVTEGQSVLPTPAAMSSTTQAISASGFGTTIDPTTATSHATESEIQGDHEWGSAMLADLCPYLQDVDWRTWLSSLGVAAVGFVVCLLVFIILCYASRSPSDEAVETAGRRSKTGITARDCGGL